MNGHPFAGTHLMKRKVEADLLTAAQAVCVGIAAGLYNARNATSDGVLDWAPDFPAEHAGYVVQEFLQLCRYKMNAGAREHLLKTLTIHAWRIVCHCEALVISSAPVRRQIPDFLPQRLDCF